MLAREMGLLKLGKVRLDGTKVKANASKHHALSWDHANKLEQQLKVEVDKFICLAEQADSEEIPEGMDIPEEFCRLYQVSDTTDMYFTPAVLTFLQNCHVRFFTFCRRRVHAKHPACP